jgi:hypothetical protein
MTGWTRTEVFGIICPGIVDAKEKRLVRHGGSAKIARG